MAAETAPRISRMLWAPSAQRIAETQLSEFQQRIESTYDQSFSGYSALHQWSIDSPAEFWQSVVDVCVVPVSYTHLRAHEDQRGSRMPSSA